MKELRKRTGMTQGDLADKLGIHVTVVSKWERGVQPIPPKYHEEIADLLDVTPRVIGKMADPIPSTEDLYRKWISDVISSDLDPKVKVILVAMVSIVDVETDVCVASFEELAEASKIPAQDIRDAWSQVASSGFIRSMGMEAVSKILK